MLITFLDVCDASPRCRNGSSWSEPYREHNRMEIPSLSSPAPIDMHPRLAMTSSGESLVVNENVLVLQKRESSTEEIFWSQISYS